MRTSDRRFRMPDSSFRTPRICRTRQNRSSAETQCVSSGTAAFRHSDGTSPPGKKQSTRKMDTRTWQLGFLLQSGPLRPDVWRSGNSQIGGKHHRSFGPSGRLSAEFIGCQSPADSFRPSDQSRSRRTRCVLHSGSFRSAHRFFRTGCSVCN